MDIEGAAGESIFAVGVLNGEEGGDKERAYRNNEVTNIEYDSMIACALLEIL